MRAKLFTLVSILACTATFAATVYKWVDQSGVTHYSDQPHENAEKVTVAAPQTYSAPPGARNTPNSGAPTRQAERTYSCTVVQPGNEETFQNTSTVTAAAQSSPTPHDGDQIVLLLDGARLPNFPSTGGSVTIDPIDRGTHSLQAVVQDSTGKPLCQSAAVTFTVLQASLLNPANPNHRH